MKLYRVWAECTVLRTGLPLCDPITHGPVRSFEDAQAFVLNAPERVFKRMGYSMRFVMKEADEIETKQVEGCED